MKNIWSFESSSEYLRSYIKSLPKAGYGQAKRIAEHLGVSSTYISQVISSERFLSLEQANALGLYLGFSSIEQDYWMNLIQLERSGTKELKNYFRKNLEKLKADAQAVANRLDPKKVLSDEEKSIFYSSTIYSVVHLFCSIGTSGASLDSIIERFELSRTKAIEVIRFLLDCGLLKEENGLYQLGIQSTHIGQGSPHLLKHHANWRIKAIQASESISNTELMYTSQVTLSKKDFDKLREQMIDFIKIFLDQVHASPAEDIACFNLDWFWYKT